MEDVLRPRKTQRASGPPSMIPLSRSSINPGYAMFDALPWGAARVDRCRRRGRAHLRRGMVAISARTPGNLDAARTNRTGAGRLTAQTSQDGTVRIVVVTHVEVLESVDHGFSPVTAGGNSRRERAAS